MKDLSLFKLRRLVFLFLFLNAFCTTQTLAQYYECENIPSMDDVWQIINNTGGPRNNKIVKVYFKRYVSQAEEISFLKFNSAILQLNANFLNAGIEFYYTRCEVEQIVDNIKANSKDECTFFNQPGKATDGISIHVTEVANGYAKSIPGDEILISYEQLDYSTISHEMGHCFGLFHTHQGVCTALSELDCNGNTINSPSEDFCSDTKLSPPLFTYVDESCNFKEGDMICNSGGVVYPKNVELIENIMSYSPVTCRFVFTNDQITRMHSLIPPHVLKENKPVDILDVWCYTPFQEIDINCDETYNFIYDLTINGELRVKSGYHLKIQSDIMFTSESQIIVEQGAKLTIEGAKLTTCPLSPSWKGIKVSADYPAAWGFGPPSTEVIVRGEGIVEHAEVAIDAVGQLTFLSTSNMGGAKITIESGSAISHCGIGVKLGPLYGVNDLSSFDNSFFNYNDRAVQLENNNGLEITNCTFQHNYLDIEGFTSSVYADKNTFNAPSEFSALYPQFYGSTFINNDFFTDNGSITPTVGGAIQIDALSNATDFIFRNNQFFGTGILGLGELDFDIFRNDFHDSPQGTWINESGDNMENFVTSNQFYGNVYANSASGINDTEYEKNCFEATTNWDIEVNEGSSIHETQGITDDASGNCFSKKIATASSSAHFDYYVLQNTIPQSCKKPGSNGNFTQLFASQDNENPCGTGASIYSLIPTRYRNCKFTNAADLKLMIAELRREIQRLEADNTMNPWIKKWLIAKYKRCLDKAIKLKAKDDRDQQNVKSVVNLLIDQPEFRYQAMAYGILMETNDLVSARTLLNTLSSSDPGEQEFVDVQNIYLDYLSDRSNHTLSPSQSSMVYNAGLRKHPLAGFARSVYYTLTGQKIPVTLTHLDGNTDVRLKHTDIKSERPHIYPNPTDKQSFTVDVPDYDANKAYNCIVYDIYGKQICNYQVTQNTQIIDLPQVSSGMYIVQITSGTNMVHVEKVIVK